MRGPAAWTGITLNASGGGGLGAACRPDAPITVTRQVRTNREWAGMHLSTRPATASAGCRRESIKASGVRTVSLPHHGRRARGEASSVVPVNRR